MEGHINRGGVYSLTARNITLKQAVAAAGGYDQLATPAKAEIILTGDDDLLVLKEFQGIRILSPRQFTEWMDTQK